MRKRSKILLVCGLLVIACVLALLAVSWNRKRSPWLEAQCLPGSLPEASLSSADRARILETATEAVKEVAAIPDDSEPFIQETDTEYIVTWPVWYSRIVPGAGYHYQIVIDKSSMKVTRKLVGG